VTTLRRIVLPLLLVGFGLFALIALQAKLDLGHFADSPQLIEVPWGARAAVGGGRAAVDFDQLEGDTATMRLWCSEEEIEVRLEPDGQTDELCGVRVRLLGFLGGRDAQETTRAALEVTWE
jgi:hypothetical protein